MHKIDMNSDVGESYGAYIMGNDEAVLRCVSSANVACGFHAGDPQVMQQTVSICAQQGVAVGAHPGYPDLVGFGRRNMACSADEVYAMCVYQIGAMAAFCKVSGIELQHVKPHGAMYNQAAKDRHLAEAIARAVKDCSPELILLGLANSAFDEAASSVGVLYAAEAFADRAYQSDGTLVSRAKPGAVIHDAALAAERVLRMARDGKVTAIDGTEVSMRPHSVCLHGDTPEAVQMADAVHAALTAEGIKICSIREVIA